MFADIHPLPVNFTVPPGILKQLEVGEFAQHVELEHFRGNIGSQDNAMWRDDQGEDGAARTERQSG